MTGNSNKTRILIVDDAPDTLEVLERNLASKGFQVLTAHTVGEATRTLEMMSVDLIITDYKMPQVDGFDLIQYVHDNFKDTEIMMITGYPSIGGAVRAVKLGACEYLEKPFTDEELFGAVDRALERLYEHRTAHVSITQQPSEFHGIIGESAAIRKVYDTINKAASTLANVLITGESGTGKELVARAIHYHSQRATSPFVPVNCGGIPEGLLESELFGHVRGSFTGATGSRVGFFEASNGGTIFLDEISETSLSMQVKLLRVLQDKEICRVGDTKHRKVDVRIVAATNKNLENLVNKGLFREDLYFRLSVVTICVPPLRERDNDVLFLARIFAKKYAVEFDRRPIQFSDHALHMLKNYYWPGNVRELENVMQRLTIMSEQEIIETPDLPSLMKDTIPQKINVHRTLAEVEREHIRIVLANVNGNKTRAAEILGIDRKTLRKKLKSISDPLSQ